eukprot:Pgem_evm1s18716
MQELGKVVPAFLQGMEKGASDFVTGIVSLVKYVYDQNDITRKIGTMLCFMVVHSADNPCQLLSNMIDFTGDIYNFIKKGLGVLGNGVALVSSQVYKALVAINIGGIPVGKEVEQVVDKVVGDFVVFMDDAAHEAWDWITEGVVNSLVGDALKKRVWNNNCDDHGFKLKVNGEQHVLKPADFINNPYKNVTFFMDTNADGYFTYTCLHEKHESGWFFNKKTWYGESDDKHDRFKWRAYNKEFYLRQTKRNKMKVSATYRDGKVKITELYGGEDFTNQYQPGQNQYRPGMPMIG